MTAKSFCAAVRRLRPALIEAQRRVNGEVRDVFLGVELKGQHAQEVSALSAHSAHYSQISLRSKQEREDMHNEFKKGNGLNDLNGVNEDLLAEEVVSDDH